MRVGIPRETTEGERRVALVPETVGKLAAQGFELVVELGAGDAASFPGDAYVRSMVHRDMKIFLSGSIFAFPGWIGVTVVFFTVGVTIVAALYPSRRAAQVDPVSALQHN